MQQSKIRLSTSGLDGFPWRDETISESASKCLSMLTPDEKTFLYWTTRRYFVGQGAIIDAGAFAGGSTMALATGLNVANVDRSIKIHTYDRFLSDAFMERVYFQPKGLAPEGKRFRHIFDSNTREVSDRVIVHDGDITSFGWDGTPVEILFIDVCKAWNVNDHCTRTWFPNLIPNRSLVIQQDFYHHLCPWVIITMELLQDHFEFIAFVEWGTAVFRCTSAVELGTIPKQLRQLGHQRLASLLVQHIDRYEPGFQKDMLNCALVVLHLHFHEVAAALKLYQQLSAPTEAKYAGRWLIEYTLKDLLRLFSFAKAS